jgi:hypothetical protein
MLAEDQITAFLKTIPKDCKNGKLLITKGIIEGDQSRFPTLVGNVIPHLTLSIDTKEPGAQAAKCTMPMLAPCLDVTPRSVIALVEVPDGALMDRLLGSATRLAIKWWGPSRASIIMRRFGRPCPKSRRTRL